MPQSEARAWWADVQDVRETIERRRAAEGSSATPRARGAERSERADRARGGERLRVVEPVVPAESHEPEAAAELSAFPAPAGLFDQDSLPLLEGRGHGRESARRRTVEITGRTVGAPTLPRLVEIDRRRPAPRAIDRVGGRPDRMAMWAVMLGIVLVLAALSSSSHAAVPHALHVAHAAAQHIAAR